MKMVTDGSEEGDGAAPGHGHEVPRARKSLDEVGPVPQARAGATGTMSRSQSVTFPGSASNGGTGPAQPLVGGGGGSEERREAQQQPQPTSAAAAPPRPPPGGSARGSPPSNKMGSVLGSIPGSPAKEPVRPPSPAAAAAAAAASAAAAARAGLPVPPPPPPGASGDGAQTVPPPPAEGSRLPSRSSSGPLSARPPLDSANAAASSSASTSGAIGLHPGLSSSQGGSGPSRSHGGVSYAQATHAAFASRWRLDGYRVLVTGSTQGIGLATAKEARPRSRGALAQASPSTLSSRKKI